MGPTLQKLAYIDAHVSYSAADWTFFYYFVVDVQKQGFMAVDHQQHYGSRNMHDHHRDLRLDIDDMTYEVNYRTLGFSDPQIAKCLSTDVFWNGWHYPGPSWSWWKDWECEHWSIQWRNLQLLVRDDILPVVSNGWEKKMCNLPGKIRMSQRFKCAKSLMVVW